MFLAPILLYSISMKRNKNVPPETFTEWDGRIFRFSGEWSQQTLGGRNVATRNRRIVWYPVYECEETNQVMVLAEYMHTSPPN